MVIRKVFFWGFFGLFFSYFQKLAFLELVFFLQDLRIGVFFVGGFFIYFKRGVFCLSDFLGIFRIWCFFVGVFFNGKRS